MSRYVATQILQIVFLVLLVATVVFVMLRVVGGDPARIAGSPASTEQVLQQFRERFGLDRPVLEQYFRYIGGIAQGDFGSSFRSGGPALQITLKAIGNTGLLVLLAMGIGLLISISCGLAAGWSKDGWFDRAALTLVAIFQSVPGFFVAIVLVLIFSIRLRWLPALGAPGGAGMVLPLLALVITLIPEQFRLVRESTIRQISLDYVRSARGFGLSDTRVLFGSVLKNAVLPLVAVVGIQLGYLLSGAVAVEVVFNYPGIGTLAQTVLTARDYPVIQAITIVGAAAFLVINLVVDLTLAHLNRRVSIR